jgi:hypothetical protein
MQMDAETLTTSPAYPPADEIGSQPRVRLARRDRDGDAVSLVDLLLAADGGLDGEDEGAGLGVEEDAGVPGRVADGGVDADGAEAAPFLGGADLIGGGEGEGDEVRGAGMSSWRQSSAVNW